MPKLPEEGIVSDVLVCTGSPAAAFFCSISNSSIAIDELGYVCGKLPRLLTTCSAV